MEMIVRGIVTGMKAFNDNVEGTHYDSTTLFVETDLDDGTSMAKGKATQAFKFGTSEEYKKLQHNPFPFSAELTMKQVTNGKNGMKTVVTAIKPIKLEQPKQ
ncbi:MAG: hypothetical protein EG826_15580 [Deltaproteobacteria bacterium]|nr:hypothetical protein [Deltaproteobacteria bacterium]